MDPEDLPPELPAIHLKLGSFLLPHPVAMRPELAASIPAQDEEDFGTIRAYFDKDESCDKGIIVLIGKLYDHTVKLYGGGEYQYYYEAVLKTIKAFLLSPGKEDYVYWYDDPCVELIEEAEMSLKKIAETGGHHHNQNQNSNYNTKDNIVGMGDKLAVSSYELSIWNGDGFMSRGEIAWRVLFHHVVKMDQGDCSSLYKSVLKIFYTFFQINHVVGEVVRKLDEIEKRKGIGLTEDVIVDNATTDLQTEDEGQDFMNDERASLIMQWAMSDRLIIQEIHFMEERQYVLEVFPAYPGLRLESLAILYKLYDHIIELDGGQYRYEYTKSFIKLFKQIRSQSSTLAGNLIDEVEVMFKEITIKKMNINETKYQEVSNSVKERMSDYRIKLFKANVDDEDDLERYRNLELAAKQIVMIYRHSLFLGGCECLNQYWLAFEGIQDIYELLCWRISPYDVPRRVGEVLDKLYDEYLDLLGIRLKKIAQKNIVAATAGDTEEASSSYMIAKDGDADVRPVIQPRHKWLNSSEILDILQNLNGSEMSKEIQQKPPSGSLILYNTKTLRFYKKDGYNWKKQKDDKTVTEGHMTLKVGGHKKLHCYYAHSIDDEKFQRRTYSLLEKSSSIRLVHYLDVSSEDNDKSENVGREVEDNSLEIRHDSPTRMKSAGTSSQTKKRPRRDSDGDDMNREIGTSSQTKKRPRRDSDGDDMNQEIGTSSQNANRAIPTNTPSLDDEMALLANEVESLPGFDTESDWFFLAIESFKDEKNRAIFRAMKNSKSKVRILKQILKL